MPFFLGLINPPGGCCGKALVVCFGALSLRWDLCWALRLSLRSGIKIASQAATQGGINLKVLEHVNVSSTCLARALTWRGLVAAFDLAMFVSIWDVM